MIIETELDIIHFVRNSKGVSDAKMKQVLSKSLMAHIEGFPKDRTVLAERLERLFLEFPEEKPLFMDFNKLSQRET